MKSKGTVSWKMGNKPSASYKVKLYKTPLNGRKGTRKQNVLEYQHQYADWNKFHLTLAISEYGCKYL